MIREFSLRELENMPTIFKDAHGELKVETRVDIDPATWINYRVWLCRHCAQVEISADNLVTVEASEFDGFWEVVDIYEAK